MHIQILDLISRHRESNLFCTLLYLAIIKKIMQMLEVPKPMTIIFYKIKNNIKLFEISCVFQK
jgi:hypothetical protein